MSETVLTVLSAPSPLVRETAAWTLFRLDPGGYQSLINQLRHDPSPQVARLIRQRRPEPCREPRRRAVEGEDTRLFRLDQEPFYELMDDRIEVARGIIHVLSQRLRARMRDLNDLRTRLEVLERSSESKTE